MAQQRRHLQALADDRQHREGKPPGQQQGAIGAGREQQIADQPGQRAGQQQRRAIARLAPHDPGICQGMQQRGQQHAAGGGLAGATEQTKPAKPGEQGCGMGPWLLDPDSALGCNHRAEKPRQHQRRMACFGIDPQTAVAQRGPTQTRPQQTADDGSPQRNADQQCQNQPKCR